MPTEVEHGIYLVWEFSAIDGPFATIEDIPRGALDLADEDPDYSLVVWATEGVTLRQWNRWWRKDDGWGNSMSSDNDAAASEGGGS